MSPNKHGATAPIRNGFYESRWAIEVFFKQIKHTLQVYDFLGHSKQAIHWQLCSALLMYLLLRF